MFDKQSSTQNRSADLIEANGICGKQIDIPKPNGGTRMLGIPSVIDRVIQQSLVITLERAFEPQFSQHSYGFRIGRSAHMALETSRKFVTSGYKWVVEIDLSKFFDRVNHDILMSRIAKVVDDKKILKLIRRYLNAGIMENGIVKSRTEGVPQGGPLSPLLSNIMLTELDRAHLPPSVREMGKHNE